MEEAVLKEVDTYVFCQHNTVAQFIVTRTILYLFLAAERRSRQKWERLTRVLIR